MKALIETALTKEDELLKCLKEMGELVDTMEANRQQELRQAYELGMIDGLTCFAWWKDGEQQVGTCGTSLRSAKEDLSSLWNYRRTLP